MTCDDCDTSPSLEGRGGASGTGSGGYKELCP